VAAARRGHSAGVLTRLGRSAEVAAPISKEIRGIIEKDLARIERQHRVRILLAVESGSRAWGFPSPDSDYDVRFLYVHPTNWYLALDHRRDVIEKPISKDLDINGWDLRKALHLLCRSNATLGEWLVSPIVYSEDRRAAQILRRLARTAINRKTASWHYLRLGQRQFERGLADQSGIRLKKYFYALRPALALAWLRLNPEQQLPMSLHQLMRGLPLDKDLVQEIETLIRLKGITKEMGEGRRVPVLDKFIGDEYAQAAEWLTTASERSVPPFAAANKAFLRLVNG